MNPNLYRNSMIVVLVLLIAAAGFFAWPRVGLRKEQPQSPIRQAVQNIVQTVAPETGDHFVEVTDGCGPYFDGTCVNVHTGPGTAFPVVTKLRNGVVLKVSDVIVADGHTWYKIVFDDWLRYPERVAGDWYVSADYVRYFADSSSEEIPPHTQTKTNKRILVDRSEQMLYAYDGDTLFMKQAVSTGLELTPTPRGTFYIYKKTPSRYMQGPIPEISDQYYDLPGVPWNLYFTTGGAVIHGAYWHNHFGEPWSHGCVNLPLDKARELYYWADIGMPVTIQD